MDIYNQADTGSESESEDDHPNNDAISGHVASLANPFQSPREIRSTQWGWYDFVPDTFVTGMYLKQGRLSVYNVFKFKYCVIKLQVMKRKC